MVDWKLDIAKECGADIVLNPSKCNLMEEINNLTDGLGCDVYIEATGAGGSVKSVIWIVLEEPLPPIFQTRTEHHRKIRTLRGVLRVREGCDMRLEYHWYVTTKIL